jgi:hypothetical protein
MSSRLEVMIHNNNSAQASKSPIKKGQDRIGFFADPAPADQQGVKEI